MYDVVIDLIRDREEKGVGTDEVFADRTFRGECRRHVDGWTGKKTFFVRQCHSITDGRTGEVIDGYDATMAWLRKLIAEGKRAEYERVIRGEKEGLMAEGLGRDVIVHYPALTMTGEDQKFLVTIDKMSRCNGTIRFHGKTWRASAPGKRAWAGVKSFYLRDIMILADPETGPVSDKESYLMELARLEPIMKDGTAKPSA
jgi:hypothetical protein